MGRVRRPFGVQRHGRAEFERGPGKQTGSENKWKGGKKELVVDSEDAHLRAIVYQISHACTLKQSGLLVQPFLSSLAREEYRSFYDVTDPEQPVHQYTVLTRTRQKALFSAAHMFG
jgi:hypothetical protein